MTAETHNTESNPVEFLKPLAYTRTNNLYTDEFGRDLDINFTQNRINVCENRYKKYGEEK